MVSKLPFVRFSLLLALLLVFALAACDSSSEPAEPAAEEAAAPAADTEAASETEASSEEAEAPAAEAEAAAPTAADDYQASREACTAESPCWAAIVEDVPASFQEAPMLAEKVAAGELPPVEERLPSDPLVIQPAEMIGQYGGILRRAYTGPGDNQNIERWNNDHHIFWDTGATELRPRIIKAWESNEDASVWTFHLRNGMKWSDGAPFTADDYIFWYEHIVSNELLVPTPPFWMQWGGDLAVMEKIDDTTFTITFAQPFPAWLEVLSTSTVAGHFNAGETGGGFVAPHHYLEQFHADFVGEEEANALAEEAGFENWYLHLLSKNNAHVNPELPVLTPWKPVTTNASTEYVLERNPYFWAVDTEGNQLPYLDGITLELVEELEVLNLRAIAGNYTIQGRHIDFSKLPVIRENEEAGDYFVDFWGSSTRNPVAVYFNMDYNGNPEIAEYTVGSRDFRKALSLAIERSEINETFFLGVGNEASLCPANASPYFPSDRWDEEFARFDLDEANAILDSIGLDQKDGEGYRLLPSGERLVLSIDAVSGSFLPYPEIGERIAQMWQEVGIQLQVNPVERSLWNERMDANEPMMNLFETGEWNPETATRLIPGNRWGYIATQWGNTPNPDPADYDGPQWLKDQILKHWEAIQTPDPELRRQRYIEGMEIMCDNIPLIGMVVNVPVYTTLIKNYMRNVPKPMEWVVYAQTPGNGYPEQFFMLQE
ncbi:MAG: ABC transporter substrate-binding protein [Caldilineaceae bacterium]|nr:ABC transporter substrate-binding protein [Caldilineaceae bacterium]